MTTRVTLSLSRHGRTGLTRNLTGNHLSAIVAEMKQAGWTVKSATDKRTNLTRQGKLCAVVVYA